MIFVGEEAVDAGGVRKEFFLLIMKELLDPKYGMFRYYEESRLIWFSNKVLYDYVFMHVQSEATYTHTTFTRCFYIFVHAGSRLLVGK